MSFAENYFSKQHNRIYELQFAPSKELQFVVVIPSYCEPDITMSLDSLWHCNRPEGSLEVIVVINYPENSGADVIKLSNDGEKKVNEWIREHNDNSFRTSVIRLDNVPVAKAGVGFARKTGMDAALGRFNILGNNHGLIICFDADCICDGNYLRAIEAGSKKYPSADGFNIYFEHPCDGQEYPAEVYNAIAQYELHLRYMNQFLRYAGFPFAYHTIGSAFAVSAQTYAAQGGMNTRKAGEDFYFLHKIIPHGKFHEINNTKVIPSPRKSDRVPFGTGAAMGKVMDSGFKSLTTYAPESFILLKTFFEEAGKLFKMGEPETEMIINSAGEPLREFLIAGKASAEIAEINRNCRTADAFIKRFFMWFNAFRVIKFLNHAQRNAFEAIPVEDAAGRLLSMIHESSYNKLTTRKLLEIYREADRKGKLSIHLQ